MRFVVCASAVCLTLALAAAPVRAQGFASFAQTGQSASVFSSGATQQVVNQPIDTSLAIAPFPGQSSGASFLPSFFRNIKLPGFPPIFGQSALPDPSSFPSTHYPNAQATKFVPANSIQPYVPVGFPQH
jgi:hypothetical protein